MAWLGWDPPECRGCASGCLDCDDDFDPGPPPEPTEQLHVMAGAVSWSCYPALD